MSWLDKRVVAAAALRHELARHGLKLVHVKLVIGENHKVLEMAGAGRRIVRQPVQRIVDALRGEWRQRQRFPGTVFECSIDDPVIGVGNIRHVKYVAQRPGKGFGSGGIKVRAFQKRKVQRDWRR